MDIKIPVKQDLKTALENSLVYSGKVKKLRTPITVHLELTFRCNSKCIMCYDESAPTRQMEELTTEEFRDLLDQCAEMSSYLITFGGGEPLLREDFFEIVEYAKFKGLCVSIVSNGALFTREKAFELRRILDLRFDSLQISVDGSLPEIHDAQRGVKGIFLQTMQGIEYINEAKIPYTMNTVLTRLNFTDIPNILRLAIEKKARTYRVMRLHPLGRARDKDFFDRLRLSFPQQCAVFEFIERKRVEYAASGIIHISSENACIFPTNHHSIRGKSPCQAGEKPASFACAAGTSTMAIGPDGYVVPCSYLHSYPELRVGNVREESLEAIWNKDELYLPYREMTEKKGKCQTCQYLNSCKGGCRAVTYSVCGDMYEPDPICNINEDDLIFEE